MKARAEVTATIYDRKGNVLAKAQNSYVKTHPIQKRFAGQVGEVNKEFLHAEVHAIIKAQKRGTPYKIKIERYGKGGEPRLAKPCPICELAIKESGIKFIEYTC
jgi:tRNA(Arg) A34 adenosine deaminase TadA